MRAIRLSLALLILAGAPAAGQSRADSLGALHAVADSLRAGGAVLLVASPPAGSPTADPELLRALADTLGVPLAAPDALPRVVCPWDAGDAEGAGLRAALEPPRFQSGTSATLEVHWSCAHAERPFGFSSGERYRLERRGGGWEVVERIPLWIS